MEGIQPEIHELPEEDLVQATIVLRQLREAEDRLMVCHRAMDHVVQEIGMKLGLDEGEWGFDQDELRFVRIREVTPV